MKKLVRQVKSLKDCLLMNDYANRCSVTNRLMPTQASLLQFRKAIDTDRVSATDKKTEFFFVTDF